eukprot:snap_masked-scaffold_12-processed-gene-10.51-mRNA-1 protein AED:0.46 eAED:0.55 QI:0/0/0/1/1/1/2/0/81
MDSQYVERNVHTKNQSAIRIANEQVGNARTRHLDIKLWFIRDALKSWDFVLRYVNGDDDPAGLFTKPLSRCLLSKHRDNLL